MNNKILVIALSSLLLLVVIGGSPAFAYYPSYCDKAYSDCAGGCVRFSLFVGLVGLIIRHPEIGPESYAGCTLGCYGGYMNCTGGF